MKTINERLIESSTIANFNGNLLTANDIGEDKFTSFKFAEQVAYEALYRYAVERHDIANIGGEVKVDKTFIDDAMKSVQILLDCLDEVNGHFIRKSMAMLDTLASCTMAEKKELIGEAWKQKSIVDNLRKEVRNIRPDMSEEYIADLYEKYDIAKIKLTELKKKEDSCESNSTRVSFNTFRKNLEAALGDIVAEKAAKTWDELEAEEAARKEAQKARNKAKRRAKRQAEAKARTAAKAEA